MRNNFVGTDDEVRDLSLLAKKLTALSFIREAYCCISYLATMSFRCIS